MSTELIDDALKRADKPPEQLPGLAAAWSLFCRRWLVLALCVAIAVGLAGLYCVVATPVYESSTRILVARRDPGLPAKGTDSQADSEESVSERLLATHIELLLSTDVVGSALQKAGLDERPSIERALDDDQDAVEYVVENLGVTRGGEGQGRAADIINLTFRHSSAADCAEVLRSIVESYQEFLADTIEYPIEQALELVEQARDNFEKELRVAEEKLQDFLINAPVLWKGTETLNVAQLVSLEAELTQVNVELVKTEARLNTLTEAKRGKDGRKYTDLEMMGLIDAAHTPRISLLVAVQQGGTSALRSETANIQFNTLLELIINEKQLQRWAGRGHPEMARNQQAIQAIQEFLGQNESASTDQLSPATVIAAYTALLHNDLANLQRRKTELETLRDREENRARALVQDEVKKAALEEEVQRTRQLFASVHQRVDEVQIARDYSGFITKVIEPVEIGEQVSPKPVLFVLLGAFVGFCLGGVIAVVVDQADATFVSDDDIRWTLGLPVLAHLPQIPRMRKVDPGRVPSAIGPLVVVHHRPDSPEADAFRRLRTLLSHGAGAKAQVIQITSPNWGDGKTTVAANLAISVARAGKNVLLVDANLCRPRLAEVFALPHDPGLSSLLAGDDTLEDVVQATEVNGLWLVASGPRLSDSSELLTLPTFDTFLSQVRQQYDAIVLDSAALLDASDSIEIASRADAVILTIHANKNAGDCALRARDTLSALDVTVLGVVVNAASGRRPWGIGQARFDSTQIDPKGRRDVYVKHSHRRGRHSADGGQTPCGHPQEDAERNRLQLLHTADANQSAVDRH